MNFNFFPRDNIVYIKRIVGRYWYLSLCVCVFVCVSVCLNLQNFLRAGDYCYDSVLCLSLPRSRLWWLPEKTLLSGGGWEIDGIFSGEELSSCSLWSRRMQKHWLSFHDTTQFKVDAISCVGIVPRLNCVSMHVIHAQNEVRVWLNKDRIYPVSYTHLTLPTTPYV